MTFQRAQLIGSFNFCLAKIVLSSSFTRDTTIGTAITNLDFRLCHSYFTGNVRTDAALIFATVAGELTCERTAVPPTNSVRTKPSAVANLSGSGTILKP